MPQLVLGRNVGTPVGRLTPVLQALERRLFARVDFHQDTLDEHLAAHPRLLYVIAHSGVISWVPITTALINRIARRTPDRLGTGTFHKAMWNMPGLNRVARWFSGAQRHLKYDELRAALSSGDCDFYAFPESENSLYGRVGEIQPFRFFRFIELAVAAKMPMLLVAHSGSEEWYRSVSGAAPLLSALPGALFSLLHLDKERVLAETASQRLNIPLPLGRIALRAKTELAWPLAWETGFSDDPEQRKTQLAAEGERLRQRLQALTDSLNADSHG